MQQSIDGGFEKFIEECIGFLKDNRTNHESILSSESFLQMNDMGIRRLLDCDDLCVDEPKIWQYTLIWARVQSRNMVLSKVAELDDEKTYSQIPAEDIENFNKISAEGQDFRERRMSRYMSRKVKISLHPDENYKQTTLEIGEDKVALMDILHVGIGKVRGEGEKGRRVLIIICKGRNNEIHLWAATSAQAEIWMKGLRCLIKESQEAADLWEKKFDRRGDRFLCEMLNKIKDSIRFGLMGGECIAKKVKKYGILTSEQLVAIYTYQYDKSNGCAGFNTKKRMT